MTLRRTVSLTALLSFIVLIVSSVVLYITPQGKIAFWAGWRVMGLDKEEWGALHTNVGILFILAGLLHTIINWKCIVTYLKNKKKAFRLFTGDFNAALLITLAIVLGTLFELPPVRAVQEFNYNLKKKAAKKYGNPPYGHAESSSLEQFCRQTRVPLDSTLSALQQAGIEGVSPEATLEEIATANRTTPRHLHEIIRQQQSGRSGSSTKGGGNAALSGLGRKTFGELCREEGVAPSAAVAALREQGMSCNPRWTVRQVADENGCSPREIFNLVRNLRP